MTVLALIATIAAIAIPSLQKYVRRAQRNEAHINLKGIFEAQKTFFTESGRYGDTFGEIGFEILGGKLVDPNTIQSKYYTYTMNAIAVNGRPGANFRATATADLDPGDAILDILMIENDLLVLK